MSATKKLLAGTAAVAALIGVSTPAAAQYYPGYGGYGNNPGAAVGQVINGVIAATQNGIAAAQYGGYQYGNYGYGQSYAYGGRTIPAQVAVNQCSGAVEARLNGGGYNSGYGNGYGGAYGGGYGNGYGGGYGAGGYGNAAGGGRVSGITRIEARNRGALRVYGVISTAGNYGYQGGSYQGGGYAGGGYGGYNGGYNGGGYGAPTLGFTCKVDYSGRVIDLKIDRYGNNPGW